MSVRHRPRRDQRLAPGIEAGDVPMDATRPRRARTRRGGSRTALPLLPVIGIAAIVAILYVSTTAFTTQATYEVAALTSQQTALKIDNQRLADELDQFKSAERVDSAAQHMGMRPAAQWSYVAAAPPVVAVPPAPQVTADQQSADALTRLVAVLSGSFGTRNAEAAGR